MAAPTDWKSLSSYDELPMSPSMTRLCAAVLSRYVCESRHSSRLIRADELVRVFNRYARTPVAGEKAPPFDGWEDCAPRSTGACLRVLGMTTAEVKDRWQAELDTVGVEAALGVELLTVMFPAQTWPVLARMIEDGPGVATERLERLLRDETQRRVKPTRRRPKGGVVSQGVLNNLAVAASRVMKLLVELHGRGHGSRSELQAWTTRPRLNVPEGERHVTDTTAPPLPVVRLAWQGLQERIAQLLHCRPEDELEAVATAPVSTMTRAFRLLRSRAMLGLMFCLGPRVDAVERLTVADYVRQHRRPDGGVGPAIKLRPCKRENEWTVRIKPIPEGLAAVIETYLAFTERILGRSLPDEAPLLASSCTWPLQAWSDYGIRNCLSGKDERKTGRRVIRALLPKESEYCGYTPHTLRSAATQGVRSPAAARLLQQHDQGGDAVFQVLIADVLTDHEKLDYDQYGYAGAKKPEDRERLSGIGAQLLWDLLTTDAGARRALDADGYRSTLHKRVALEGELDSIRRELRTLFARAESAPTKGELVLTTLLRSSQLMARKDHIQEELRDTERELQELRLNPARRVVVPDDLPETPKVDFESIEREVVGGVAAHQRRRLAPVRDWLTVKELAWVLDVSEATARRWVEGKLPERERKRPWPDAESAPIDDSLGSKRKRIAVSGINPALLDSEVKRQRLAELLAHPPEGWTPEQAAAPFKAPKAPAKPAAPKLRAVA